MASSRMARQRRAPSFVSLTDNVLQDISSRLDGRTLLSLLRTCRDLHTSPALRASLLESILQQLHSLKSALQTILVALRTAVALLQQAKSVHSALTQIAWIPFVHEKCMLLELELSIQQERADRKGLAATYLEQAAAGLQAAARAGGRPGQLTRALGRAMGPVVLAARQGAVEALRVLEVGQQDGQAGAAAQQAGLDAQQVGPAGQQVGPAGQQAQQPGPVVQQAGPVAQAPQQAGGQQLGQQLLRAEQRLLQVTNRQLLKWQRLLPAEQLLQQAGAQLEQAEQRQQLTAQQLVPAEYEMDAAEQLLPGMLLVGQQCAAAVQEQEAVVAVRLVAVQEAQQTLIQDLGAMQVQAQQQLQVTQQAAQQAELQGWQAELAGHLAVLRQLRAAEVQGTAQQAAAVDWLESTAQQLQVQGVPQVQVQAVPLQLLQLRTGLVAQLAGLKQLQLRVVTQRHLLVVARQVQLQQLRAQLAAHKQVQALGQQLRVARVAHLAAQEALAAAQRAQLKAQQQMQTMMVQVLQAEPAAQQAPQAEPAGQPAGQPAGPGAQQAGAAEQQAGPAGQQVGPAGLHAGPVGQPAEPAGPQVGPAAQQLGPAGQQVRPAEQQHTAVQAVLMGEPQAGPTLQAALHARAQQLTHVAWQTLHQVVQVGQARLQAGQEGNMQALQLAVEAGLVALQSSVEEDV